MGMGVRHRLARLLERRHILTVVLSGAAAMLQKMVEGLSLDKLHCQERPAICQDADLVHGGNARVLQSSGYARLAEKALGRQRIGSIALGKQFNGDISIEGNIAGAVDDAHTAVADFLDQLIARRVGRATRRLMVSGVFGSASIA
jgi:hypothetical protein